MLAIYKYEVHAGRFSIELPEDSVVLTVAVQYGEPRIWVLHDLDKPKKLFHFVGGNTGLITYPLSKRDKYIGTFFLEGGSSVWHLFQLAE